MSPARKKKRRSGKKRKSRKPAARRPENVDPDEEEPEDAGHLDEHGKDGVQTRVDGEGKSKFFSFSGELTKDPAKARRPRKRADEEEDTSTEEFGSEDTFTIFGEETDAELDVPTQYKFPVEEEEAGASEVTEPGVDANADLDEETSTEALGPFDELTVQAEEEAAVEEQIIEDVEEVADILEEIAEATQTEAFGLGDALIVSAAPEDVAALQEPEPVAEVTPAPQPEPVAEIPEVTQTEMFGLGDALITQSETQEAAPQTAPAPEPEPETFGATQMEAFGLGDALTGQAAPVGQAEEPETASEDVSETLAAPAAVEDDLTQSDFLGAINVVVTDELRAAEETKALFAPLPEAAAKDDLTQSEFLDALDVISKSDDLEPTTGEPPAYLEAALRAEAARHDPTAAGEETHEPGYETALDDDLFTRPELIQSPEFRPVHDAPLVSERVIEDGTPVAPKPRRRRVATRRRSWLAGAFKKVAGLLGRTSTSEKKWHKDLVALAEELEPVAQIDPATASRDLHEELKTDSNLLGDLAKMETGATKTLDADGRLIETARTISTQAPLRERLRHRVRRLGTHVKETLQALFLVGQRKHALETGPKGAAWWRRTLIEIGTLYAIIIPIEITVSQGHVGSYGVHPHPYWLVVLPMAGARGVVAALVAATIGAILYVVGVIQALGTIPTSQLFTLKTMLEPLLFFGSGFFLGELHDELAARHKRVKRRLREAEEQYSSVRQEREVLSEANKILETRIVDHSAQFGNVIVAAERIERSDRSEIFEVALDLVEEHCGASASALLLLGDGSIDYICHRGWPDEERGERLGHARRSSLVHRAIQEGTAINGFAGDNAPTQGPLVAAPLFDDKGVVKALLCLDEIPASRLNESTINTFLGICDWICSAMVRLSRGGQPTDTRATFQSQPQDELRLGAVEELGSRLRLEYERCARYGVPTSILALHAIEWTDTSREGDAAIDRYMLSHFTGGMRPGDGLYRFGYPGCYVVVLAGTPLEGAEVVRGRLLRRIEYSAVSTAGRVEIYATGPDVEAPDLMTLIERIARQFRRSSPLPLDATCPVPIPGFAPVGNLDAFLRRLRLETSLAARNSFDLHVVGIAATNQEAADGELLAGHIDQIGESVLRPSDGAYRIGPNQCAIILPNTDAEASALVVHRIVTTLRERDPDAPYGDLETQVLGLGPSYPNASSFLSALARAKPTESTGFGAKGGDK